ncbi:MAG: DUF6165 family protein [Pseudomonadota bacterium]
MATAIECPHIPVSWGELLDKITILEIKRERIAEPPARANVELELKLLRRVAGRFAGGSHVQPLVSRLKCVNAELWEIEDDIRAREAEGDFGPRFIALARSVYHRNDLRAALKRQINQSLGSLLVEEKSYTAPAPLAERVTPGRGAQPGLSAGRAQA